MVPLLATVLYLTQLKECLSHNSVVRLLPHDEVDTPPGREVFCVQEEGEGRPLEEYSLTVREVLTTSTDLSRRTISLGYKIQILRLL